MYDYDRLDQDVKLMRLKDPHGMSDNNTLEWRAKVLQLEELCDRVQDPVAQFILAELIRRRAN